MTSKGKELSYVSDADVQRYGADSRLLWSRATKAQRRAARDFAERLIDRFVRFEGVPDADRE